MKTFHGHLITGKKGKNAWLLDVYKYGKGGWLFPARSRSWKSQFQQEEPDSAPAGSGGLSLGKKGIAVLSSSQLPASHRCSSRGFPACLAMESWSDLGWNSLFARGIQKGPKFLPCSDMEVSTNLEKPHLHSQEICSHL